MIEINKSLAVKTQMEILAERLFESDYEDLVENDEKYQWQDWPIDNPIKAKWFSMVGEAIDEDGHNMEGFELEEIPEPHVFLFNNNEKKQSFNAVIDEKTNSVVWMYVNGSEMYKSLSIAEAIDKDDTWDY